MEDMPLTIGAAAPDFDLTAVGSGRLLSPSANEHDAVMLVFHDQNGVDQVQAMQAAVRSRYADARQLSIASVVNMSVVPVFLRSTAESVMRAGYHKAATALPETLNAADYIIILLDWDGKVSKAYGARKVSKQPLLVLINGAGIVCGIHRGRELVEPALAMLAEQQPLAEITTTPEERTSSIT